MKRSKGYRIWVVALALAVLAVPAMAIGDTASAPAMTVEVGHDSATVQFDQMFPGTTYIHVGDSVTFTNAAKAVPHTVTFAGGGKMPAYPEPAAVAPSQPSGGEWNGKGLLNSGMMAPGQSYTVTFTQVGVFDYACALHPLMRGQIVVLPADAAIPSVDDGAAAAKAQQAVADDAATAIAASYSGRLPSGSVNSDGSVNWDVTAGAGIGSLTVDQFFPANLVVSEGDSVTFTNRGAYEFHFVTFPVSPDDAAKFIDGHEPNVPALMTPMGGTTVDGSQLVNSGAIFAHQSVTFSFPKAGTYPYYCYLHGAMHMEGVITVQPKGTIHAYVNGKPLLYSGYKLPHVHGQHVFVPVTEVIKALGGSVAWDGDSQTVAAVTSGTAQATVGEGNGVKVLLNSKPLAYAYDPQPHIHDGHVFVPVQELANALGGRLTWDAATKTVNLEVNQG